MVQLLYTIIEYIMQETLDFSYFKVTTMNSVSKNKKVYFKNDLKYVMNISDKKQELCKNNIQL